MMNEPDEEQGTWHGYEWRLLRMPATGIWCGYVLLPDGHPWHGLDTWALRDVAIHGGVTFAGRHPKFDDAYAVGFDCGHAGDVIPKMGSEGMTLSTMSAVTDMVMGLPVGKRATYKDIGYVRDEVKLLCEQAGAARKEPNDD